MDKYILSNQTAFIHKRYIGNNILDLYSLIEAAEQNEEEAMVILLDIEKAFDTIDWDFMRNVFLKSGFPEYFIRWLDAMQNGKELRVFTNGYSSDVIYPKRGMAQGCCLSPLIFICAMEMLANVVRQNPRIPGISVNNFEKKIALAADDMLLCALANEEVMEEINLVLDRFAFISGLSVNFSKSLIFRIGTGKEKGPLVHGLQFKWLRISDLFSYLGISFSVHAQGTLQGIWSNFSKNPRFVEEALAGTQYVHSGLLGRICCLKALVASKLVYKFSLAPSPHKDFLRFMDRLFYDYIWNSGRHRISKKIMQQSIENGGFNMLNIVFQENSLKLIWLQRLLNTEANCVFWVEHIRSCLILRVTEILRCNVAPRRWPMHKFLKKSCSLLVFWHNVFEIYFKWTYVGSRDLAACSFVGNMPICFNSALPSFSRNKFSGAETDYFNFKRHGIVTISQFLTANLSVKEKIECKWFLYFDIIPVPVLRNLGMEEHPFENMRQKMIIGTCSVKDFSLSFQRITSTTNDKAISKWSRDLSLPVDTLWKKLCCKGKLIFDKKLRAFHIQFLNRAYLLNNINCNFMAVSEMCPLCNNGKDCYPHAFWSCEMVCPIWQSLIPLLESIVSPDENDFNMANCLLSNFNAEIAILTTVFLKRYIIYSRFLNYKVHVCDFFAKLKGFRNACCCRCSYMHCMGKHYLLWDILVDDTVFDIFNV